MNSPKITAINYGRTINLGNYESTRIDFTAKVADDEDWRDVLRDLKILVNEEALKESK